MGYKERLGATSDSLRIKNNEWYVARSVTEKSDVRVFRVNLNDEIEFASIPSVGGDSFVLKSSFDALEERVSLLEAIVGTISAGNINIVSRELSIIDVEQKSFIIPNTPLPTQSAIIVPESGIPQLQGVDFEISGNLVSWDGLPYEQLAADGDRIKIIYMFGL